MAEVVVAKVSDLEDGKGKPVEANGKPLALFKQGGKFYCVDNTCAHMGGPLGEGQLDGTTVACPWHGYQYDITTGECTSPGGVEVKTYPVEVKGEDVVVTVD